MADLTRYWLRWLEHITDPITKFLIEDIARRIKDAGELTSTAAYQAFRLQFLGKGMSWIEEQLAVLIGVAVDEVSELLERAASFGYTNDIKKLGGAVEFKDNPSMQQIVSTATSLAKADLTNITQTIGFIGPDGVSRTLTDAYINATDFALIGLITEHRLAPRYAGRGEFGKPRHTVHRLCKWRTHKSRVGCKAQYDGRCRADG